MTEEHFEERLGEVRRASRRWRAVLGCALAVIAAGAWRGSVADTVVAKRFELVDEQGRVRGDLAMDGSGPVLTLRDEKGGARASLFFDGESVALYLRDEKGQPRVGAAHFGAVSGLSLHGPEGKGTVAMTLREGKEPSVRFYDMEGKVVREIAAPGRGEAR